MAHFAKLDENNIVIDVNAVHNNELLDENGQESEVQGIQFLTEWSGGYANWKQTSYNGNMRKNYAGIGYTYDAGRDAFIAPQPFASWLLDEATCQWQPPTPRPVDGDPYVWDEATTSWVVFDPNAVQVEPVETPSATEEISIQSFSAMPDVIGSAAPEITIDISATAELSMPSATASSI